MKWKNTWILVGLAAALFAFIFLVERNLRPTGATEPPQPLFPKFRPAAATSLQVRRGTQLALALEQTNGAWRFVKPVAYPAANFAVQSFLEAIDRMTPVTHISPREILARKQTAADFGFDPPPVVIALGRNGEQPDLQIRFGARTPAGDQVYVAVGDQPGYFVVSAEILDNKVPRMPHDWRDTALFHFGENKIDRVEIAPQRGVGFVLALDATNQMWRLARPSHRANQLQARQWLDKLQLARAIEFVTDEPGADGEAYGLQPPQFELTLKSGDNAQKIQFGRSPTNDPGRVYARILAHTNIVLVAKSTVDLLNTSPSDLRDRQLVAFAPELVDVIDVRGEVSLIAADSVTNGSFIVRKNGNGAWMAGEVPVDPVFFSQWLGLLSQIEVTEFVKDVATDFTFTAYGLEPAQRQYLLYTSVTNATGPTNVLITRLGFGTNAAPDRAFARRWDEDSVYSISLREYTLMPAEAWQFRDHRVWRFATNQVAKITVQEGNETREVLRQTNGEWVVVKGFANEPNPFALEEVALGLGDLRALMWVARGESARARFGAPTAQLSVELRGEKPQVLTVEFVGRSPLLTPYGLVVIDGQPTVFEFPWTLYGDLQRYLNLGRVGNSRSLNVPAPGKL
jgi:hypothetical protein